MTRSQFLIGLVVVAAVALGIGSWFVFTGSSSSDASASATPSVLLAKDDHALGSPKAPITIIEYAAPMCPHCAHFDMNVFPEFKRQYIDSGKVYFVFRVFPLGAPDVAVEAMARCLPKESYFQFIDMMYRNQSQWDPDGYTIPDIHAALVHMGAIAGMTADQVNTCIANPVVQQQIQQVGSDAQSRYGVYQTPSFIIDGRLENPATLEDMKAILDPELAKK